MDFFKEASVFWEQEVISSPPNSVRKLQSRVPADARQTRSNLKTSEGDVL